MQIIKNPYNLLKKGLLMEINIYQVFEGNLASSVVRLLEKVYSSGKRCIFYSPIEDRVKTIDKILWTFSTNAFIPHGDKTVGSAEQQPIYFTDRIENPNNADILLIMDTFEYQNFSGNFEKIMFVFEDSAHIKVAEELYQVLKKSSENVNYWKQSKIGWEKIN